MLTNAAFEIYSINILKTNKQTKTIQQYIVYLYGWPSLVIQDIRSFYSGDWFLNS